MIRIGQGYDAHRFVPERSCILGGVTIDYPLGMEAHSDGDVVVHALCDALLGALCLGDIGHYFPDTDEQYNNIDSRIILRQVVDMIHEKGWRVGNADNTVIAQKPKLAPYLIDMRQNLAADLQVGIEQVSVKATTTERMGFTGRAEGIAVNSVVLLEAISS